MAVSCVPGTLIDWIAVELPRSPIHDVKGVLGFVKAPGTDRINRNVTVHDPSTSRFSSYLKSVCQPPNVGPSSEDQAQPGQSMVGEGQCTTPAVVQVMQARTTPRRVAC